MTCNTKLWTVLVGIWIICYGAHAQEHVTQLHADNIFGTSEVNLDDSLWNFSLEKIPINSCPSLDALDAQGWDTMRHTAFGEPHMLPGWRGIGWFAITLKAGQELVGRKLAFRVNHDGASEFFLDGRPLGGYGRVGRAAQEMRAERAPHKLIALWLPDTAEHLLVIHYSNFVGTYPNFWGFHARIGDFDRMSDKMEQRDRLLGFLPMCAAANFILALLHVFLFLYYPRQRLSLEYAFCTMLLGMIGIGIYLYYQASSPVVQYYADFFSAICKILLLACACLMFYRLAYIRIHRWRLMVLSCVTLYYLVDYVYKYFISPVQHANNYFSLALLFFLLDVSWTTAAIIRNRKKGVWLIGIGMVALILLYFFTWGDVFKLWTPGLSDVRTLVLGIGILLFPVFFSLYQAIDFTMIRQQLAAKSIEVEQLLANALNAKMQKQPSFAFSGLLSGDEAFLNRVMEVIREHLHDELFGADQLANIIGLSRAQLYRKLKASSAGQSTGDLIRTVRLEHAYGLLQQRIATVTEVGYMVGFASPASFSASFSRYFGFPPSKVEQNSPTT